MNEGWNRSYLQAMKEASVMLFIITADYFGSPLCLQEWDQFVTESNNRDVRNPLYGLCICFAREDEARLATLGKPIKPNSLDTMLTPRIETTSGHMTALKLANPGAKTKNGKGWAIGEPEMLQIISKIRPHLPD